VVAAFSDLGYNPGQEFLGQSCQALRGKLAALGLEPLASLMTAFARQRYYPGAETTDEAVAAASDKFRAESGDGCGPPPDSAASSPSPPPHQTPSAVFA